jgi:hypothetical protein
MHVPPVQTMPHPPQLALSDERSTHLPPGHFTVDPGHTHAPATHDPTPQLTPHAPQFAESVFMSVHAPLHVSGFAVGHAHEPLMHDAPVAHALVHEPHAVTSFDRSLQVPLHFTRPGAHAHTPLSHAEPSGHLVPHAPQF